MYSHSKTSAMAGQLNLDPSADEAVDVLFEAQALGLISADDKAFVELKALRDMGDLNYKDALSGARAALVEQATLRALGVLKGLFRPGDIVELCAIGTEKGSIAICGDLFDNGQVHDLAEFIHAQFGHANLYVGICPRKPEMAGVRRRAKDADVLCRRHVALDLDDKDAPDVDESWVQTLEALRTLEPVLVVRSGNGWQVWFEVDEQAGGALSASKGVIGEALASIGSDPVFEPSRLMRLPYTLNIPKVSKRKRGAVLRLAVPTEVSKYQEFAA